MSHLKERVDRNCLNCNAQVAGRYCQICGQENIEVKETIWHLITHFFNDITHFDGKFFSTLRYLVFQPGFISREYMKGRRASYLNPVRMYIFTSAIFFLIFFSVFKVDEKSLSTNAGVNKKQLEKIAEMDSAGFARTTAELNKGVPMTRAAYKKYLDTVATSGLHFTGRRYKNRQEYDAVLANGEKKHNWLQRQLIKREIELNEKYDNDTGKILGAFLNILFHSFPQMLFISLPLFALLLQLLYFRSKQYYYTNHIIFSVHLHIMIFIVFLMIIGLTQLINYTRWQWMFWIVGFLYAFLFFYEYKAMRHFYGQGRARTVLKFFLLNLLHPLVIALLFIIFTFFSFLKT